jgi:threonine dehydrogenase-like Zn-dependent dehydrogenase
VRGLVYIGPRQLEWQERPEPRIESDKAAVVRPLAVATCDLDSLIVTGTSPFPPPFTIGHEGVAEVVEVGDAVRLFKPGDRVLVPFQISCGFCDACIAGRTGNCLTVPLAQTYGFGFGPEATRWGGFLADAIGVPFADAMLVAVPDEVPSAVAANASDNLTDAYRAVGPQLAERPGAPVLVTGGAASGSIGLFAVALALELGSEEVVYIDEDGGRRAVAAALGASVLDQLPERLDHRFPITVNAGSSADSLALCLASLDRDGVCTSTSIAFDPASVPTFPLLSMYVMSTTFVTGRIHARHHAPTVLTLLAGELDIGPILTREASFDDALEALLEPHTKLILTPAEAG